MADGQVTGKTDRKSKDCRSVAVWRAVSAASGTRKWTWELEGLQCFPPPPDSVYLACSLSIIQYTNTLTHAFISCTHTLHILKLILPDKKDYLLNCHIISKH